MSAESKFPSYDARVIQRLQRMIEKTQAIADELGDGISIETNAANRARLKIQLQDVEARLATLEQQRQDAIAKDPRSPAVGEPQVRDMLFYPVFPMRNY